MGVYAIHPEYGMTIPYPEEVSIKRQLIRSSSRVIALVNPAKLNTVSRYQVCGIEDFTTLITDGHVPQEMASLYKNRGLDFLYNNITKIVIACIETMTILFLKGR